MNTRNSGQPVCRSWLSDGRRAAPALRPAAGILVLAVATAVPGAEPATNGLPAAAAVQVNFDRDIRPILEQSCLRCHGAERPKSHFRLTGREAALQGGDDNADDIVPGNSAASRLIQYVAGAVPDRQMPPPDKAEPLAPAQVSLLRAWIDQGANWGATNACPQSAFAIAPMLRWTSVEGDAAKFREIEGFKEGWGGGIGSFSLEEQDTPDTKLTFNGHVLMPEEDLKLNLLWTKTDGGFIRAGFEHWRKYFDDHGGFFPPTNTFSLDRDLHLDLGRAWIDFGLTLPDWPQLVLGYEYQFKSGDEGTLQWGAVAIPNSTSPKNIFPAPKHIDESTHIIKLDASGVLLGWRLEDNARVEFYTLDTTRTNLWPDAFFFSPPDSVTRVAESDRHTQGANMFSVSKQLADWVSVSGGYFYSLLEGGASVNQNTLDSQGNPAVGQQWSAENVTLKRQSQLASFGSLLGPWSGLLLSAGVQGEWTRQESQGLQQLLFGTPANTDPFNSSTNQAVGNYNSAGARENLVLRFTKIPWTVLSAEARLRQETLNRFEEGYLQDFSSSFPSGLFTNRTATDLNSREYRVGFNTSPWQRLSLGGSFAHGVRHADYSGTNELNGNYPGFIQWRDVAENQVEARVVYRAAAWLRTSFNFKWQQSDFDSATAANFVSPGGPIEAATQEARIYSASAMLTPIRRLYLSCTFSYGDSRTTTAFDGSDGLVPWQGNVYSVLSSGTFVLSTNTAFHAVCNYSSSDYAQHNQAAGLPLGVTYQHLSLQAGVTHQFHNHLQTTLAYGFYHYHEPTMGSVTDFTAQGVLATVAVPWH
jgi:hypothetical protein